MKMLCIRLEIPRKLLFGPTLFFDNQARSAPYIIYFPLQEQGGTTGHYVRINNNIDSHEGDVAEGLGKCEIQTLHSPFHQNAANTFKRSRNQIIGYYQKIINCKVYPYHSGFSAQSQNCGSFVIPRALHCGPHMR